MDYDDFERRHRDREERRHHRARRRHEHRESRRERRHGAPKEKVLHTRVSEQLSDDIRRVADELRVPVSNLVRNVLEEAFSVVETVSENVGDLLEDILDDAESAQHRFRRYQGRWRRGHGDWDDDGYEPDEPDPRDGDEPDEDRASGTPETNPAAPEPAGEGVHEDGPGRAVFEEVLGWQPLVLNRSVECAGCGRPLKRGGRAFMGLTEAGGSATFLCRRCVEER